MEKAWGRDQKGRQRLRGHKVSVKLSANEGVAWKVSRGRREQSRARNVVVSGRRRGMQLKARPKPKKSNSKNNWGKIGN